MTCNDYDLSGDTTPAFAANQLSAPSRTDYSVGASTGTEAMTTPATTGTYRVQGVSRPGGHGRIRCNTTDIKADTGSISDGFRPGPAELLCASLAACLLKNIERYSEMLPFEYEMVSVVVDADRQDVPPRMIRMRYRIEIVTDEPDARVELLHRNVRKFGTITNTLASACDLTGEVVALPPDARRNNPRVRVTLRGGEDGSPACCANRGLSR